MGQHKAIWVVFLNKEHLVMAERHCCAFDTFSKPGVASWILNSGLNRRPMTEINVVHAYDNAGDPSVLFYAGSRRQCVLSVWYSACIIARHSEHAENIYISRWR